jgi:hypothetical protein
MQRLGLLLLGVAGGSSILSAGQVYGTVRDASGKGLAGVQIVIVSPAKASYEGKTGPDGSYQIFVKETGKCEIRVDSGTKAPATASVFSYAEPSKYDFELAGGSLKAK